MSASVPPGVVCEGSHTEKHSGGAVDGWLAFEKVKLYTNAFIVEEGRILLGYKKRGFGKDLYNGFGGKVEPQETPLEAAVREMQEEAGITAPLKKCGTLFFVCEDIDHAFHIDIFVADEYTGAIIETDEMRPGWFSTSQGAPSSELPPIPYSRMWADDVFWMPMLLAGKPFIGRADFVQDGTMQKWWFAEV
ncbi:uncharacterized protein PHACADRAFT_187006 [Phanerochaete carnosa HHB-10118-sp]|uniref:Oxidized purine nucleoside triphosphate hydrolase n=1 Tax=Phanerochaete carnosa (strain HHB-10118-sp) TaxID=650164 RepID=K5UP67_PHACS|nr:uncharacterized protein PHACADRAFT_187006 [Phanerochaete carnosa HHB-10118-sp]EKM51561.1 hypothetical protein PHACADRAFT_187006 [Phanerochaete carnosa HHB-10118-sp]